MYGISVKISITDILVNLILYNVAQQFAFSFHSKKRRFKNPPETCVELACSPHACIFSPGILVSSHRPITCFIGVSKLPLGVHQFVSLWVCVCGPATDWWPFQGVPCLRPTVAGLAPTFPWPRKGIHQVLARDGILYISLHVLWPQKCLLLPQSRTSYVKNGEKVLNDS